MTLAKPAPPPEATEGSSMRAKDLKNKPCIFHPTKEGEWPAREDMNGGAYVACDVWVLDRQGVVEHGTNVKVSWWRCLDDLRAHMGGYLGGKPEQQDDNSVILAPLSDAAQKVGEQVVADLESDDPETRPFTDDDAGETF